MVAVVVVYVVVAAVQLSTVVYVLVGGGVCVVAVVKRLRVEWRVVGGLVGALPWQPRQNTELGLPLLLAPEEIALLRKKGRQPSPTARAEVVCVSGVLDLRRYATPTPSSDDVITFTRLRERNEQQQVYILSSQQWMMS